MLVFDILIAAVVSKQLHNKIGTDAFCGTRVIKIGTAESTLKLF